MSNQKFALTFYDVKDMNQFFKLVDSCREPVYLDLPDQSACDLRNNREIQALMKWMAPKTGIEKVRLQSNCSEDAGRLVHYMATQKVIA